MASRFIKCSRWRTTRQSCVRRPHEPAGQPRHRRVRGWHARILQHEVDHLDGLLYVDRMNTLTLCSVASYRDLAELTTHEAISRLTGSAQD